MAFFEYKGKTFYIDNKLDRDLTRKVYPDLLKNDKDNVFLIDGAEGSGKSKFGDILAAHAASHLGCDYNLDCVCLTPEEFKNRIQTCPNRSVVTYDEAHRGMGSKRALSEINNILVDLMMEMRQKNLFVIIIMPTFFLLEKYAALFRSKGLFHIYERKRKRGFWVFFNEKNKQKLYILGKKLLNYNVMKYPAYRGVFFNQYSMDEAAYRAKKLRIFKDKPETTEKPLTPTAKRHLEQRNILLRYLFEKNGGTKIEFIKFLATLGIKMERTTLNGIVLKENDGISPENQGSDSVDSGNMPESAENMAGDDFKKQNITIDNQEEQDFPPEEGDLDENSPNYEGITP